MKKRLASHLMLGLSLVAVPFLGGCNQQDASGSNPFLGTANAEPAVTETNLAPAIVATTNATVVVAETIAPEALQTNAPAVEAVTVEQPNPPPAVRLSPVLSEVVKLVHSGVDQTVLFNYITNTTGYFALGADEIVYLNDLGVDGEVMTAMMQHDLALRELRMNAVQAQLSVPVQAAPAEEETEVAAAPTYVDAPPMEVEPVYVSNEYFYNTLSPYGTWVYVPGYGRCWRPTVCVSNPGWRPYCDRGRWVYSDAGWYWLSDYSWGATTFHYGRWFNAPNYGWCWWPDTVWAPSWVSWRYTSAYCGWAPLPPTACYQSGFGLTYQNGSVAVGFGFGLGASAYAFVPWGNVCNPRPYKYCLPTPHAAQVYNNSTVVNHLEAGGRGRVNNRGIAPERVREYSRAEVRTVNLQEQTGRPVRGERLDRDGRTLAVHRPNLIQTGTDGENNIERGADTAGRTGSRRANEAVLSRTPQQTAVSVPSTAGRAEVRTGRGSGVEGRNSDRTAASPTPVISPSVEAKPTVATATRVEARPSGREREQRADIETVNRNSRVASPVAALSSHPETPVTTQSPTPRTQPRIIQATPVTARVTPRPTAPAPSTSVVVIGANNTRSSGRDYSVWNTGTRTPGVPSAPARQSGDNSVSRSTPSPVVSVPQSPQVADNTPSPVARTQPERSRPGRSEYGRSEKSGSYSIPAQNAQAPQPATRPAQTPSFTPRSVPSSPATTVTPRPVQSPSPGAARVESRSAPPAVAVAPATATAAPRPAPASGRPPR